MHDMQRRLRDLGRQIKDYGLESVPESALPTSVVLTEVQKYDQARLLQQLQGVPSLNADQRAVFDAVVAAAEDRQNNVGESSYCQTCSNSNILIPDLSM